MRRDALKERSQHPDRSQAVRGVLICRAVEGIDPFVDNQVRVLAGHGFGLIDQRFDVPRQFTIRVVVCGEQALDRVELGIEVQVDIDCIEKIAPLVRCDGFESHDSWVMVRARV